MEEDKKIFHVNILFVSIGWFILTFIVYMLTWLVVQTICFIPYIRVVSYYLGRFFPSFVTFAFLGVIVLFYLYSKLIRISINKREVIIKKGFHKSIHLPFDSYRFVPIKEVENTTLKNQHLYFRTIDENGYVVDYKLRYFSIDTYTKLVSAIQAFHTSALPVEFRSQVAYEDMQRGKIEFQIMRSEILKSEWMIYRKYSGCLIVIALVLFLIRSWGTGLTWYLTQILAVLMLLSLPVMAVRLVLNKKRCPYKVYRNGDFLFIDDKRFSISQIEKIVMTDVNAKSNSIFPLNRYIKLYADNKKYKYWVGSEGSMSYQQYQELCGEIERMFINASSKIVYDQK